MIEENIKNMLSSLCDNMHLIQSKVSGDEKYTITLQCKLILGNDYDEKCNIWIKRFSELTDTNWISVRRFSNATRYEFRKLYKCQHSSQGKIVEKKRKRENSRIRNKKCNASINFLFKKINRNTIKNDSLLKDGINVVVTINFEHSHKVKVAEALGYLRVTEETKTIFESYFASGMSPSAARMYHEMAIIEDHKEHMPYLLANARENPTERQVRYLYDKWRLTQYGTREESNILEVLKNKIPVFKESGGELIIKENPFMVVIITPIMRRAFDQNLTAEMVFVDSSGSCDQSNTCVTFMFASNKTGAIPIACVLHTAQTEANYTLAFSLAKEAVEVGGKLFSPKIFMTDDSCAERNALSTVFPNSILLLCIFHVCQALWRWLWQLDHNVEKDNRRLIMDMFRNVLYAPTKEDAEEFFANLIHHNVVQSNKLLLEHMNNIWLRKTEWCISYRSNIITRGNNTNNYTEASIRIFKDIVLQRCKVFNSCALVEFIFKVFENYYKRKLLEFANQRRSKPKIDYSNMCRKSKNIDIIYKVADNLFQVGSEKDIHILYTVNSELAFCDCPLGTSGKFCKHLCAVENKYGFLFKTSPILTVSDRIQLAKLALGQSAPEKNFYNNMDENNDDVNEKDLSYINDTAISCDNIPVNVINLNNDNQEKFCEEITKMRAHFDRFISTLDENHDAATTLTIIKFNHILQTIKTPAQIISFMETKSRLCGKKQRKIKVQPTSISRRKSKGLPSSGRLQAGRPSNKERVKRKHSLSLNISKNLPNAKLH